MKFPISPPDVYAEQAVVPLMDRPVADLCRAVNKTVAASFAAAGVVRIRDLAPHLENLRAFKGVGAKGAESIRAHFAEVEAASEAR